jgi:hypothetical protein
MRDNCRANALKKQTVFCMMVGFCDKTFFFVVFVKPQRYLVFAIKFKPRRAQRTQRDIKIASLWPL